MFPPTFVLQEDNWIYIAVRNSYDINIRKKLKLGVKDPVSLPFSIEKAMI